MAPPEHNYPSTANARYPKETEAQEEDLKSNLINIIEVFKEDMDKSLKEIQENTFKHVKDMNKTLEKRMESTKKTQIVAIMEIENLREQELQT